MTNRLPTTGGDTGDWGSILNSFLEVSLYNNPNNGSDPNNGTLNSGVVGTSQLQNNAVTNAQLDNSTQTILSSVASKYVKPGGGIPASDLASAVQTSITAAGTAVQVGGDLGGTNTAPTISKIQGTTVSAPSGGTTAFLNASGTWTTPAGGGGGVTLDSTNTDIQPLGSQSAGSSSQAAKADHVHPNTGLVTNTTTVNGHALSSNITVTASDVSAVPSSQLGAASGVATLNSSSQLTASQLPSSVATASRLTSQFVAVSAYGADPTGATDSTAAINEAIATGLQVYLDVPAPYLTATYKIGTSSDLTTFGRLQGLTGAGSDIVKLNYVGNNQGIKIYDSNFSPSMSVGGEFGGFSLWGYSGGAAAIGMYVGNMCSVYADDISICGFGGTGLLFQNDSDSEWSEQAQFTRIKLTQSGNNAVFNTGSFSYSNYQFLIEANANQNGVTLENGALLLNDTLSVQGNFHAASTNTGYVLGLDVGNNSGSSEFSGKLYIGVEADGTGGQAAHTSIKMGTGSATEVNAEGYLNFEPATIPFIGATVSGTFGFSGSISDATLGKITPGDGFMVQGGSQWTSNGSLTSHLYQSTIYLQFGDLQVFQLLSGNTTIVLSGNLIGKSRKIDLFIVQPSSGAVGTITWPGTFLWDGGSAPTLSTAYGAVDHIRAIYLPTASTWYAYRFVAAVPATTTTNYTPILAQNYSSMPTANLLYYGKIQIPYTTTLTGVLLYTEATAAGNVLVGLFNSSGTQVAASTSVAQGTANSVQAVPFSSTYNAAPGEYFVAVMYSSASATYISGLSYGGAGSAAQGSFALPSSITPPGASAGGFIASMSTY
jgi:hypothetical protein